LRVALAFFPGTNCDFDVERVIADVLREEIVRVNHKVTDLSEFDSIILPGGFSYGDYLRAGAIAAKMPIMNAIKRFAMSGKPVLGICNGFQILLEAKILPGALIKNSSNRFVCKPVKVKVERGDTAFTLLIEEGSVLRMPVAHAEGRYFVDESTLRQIERKDMIVFRYIDNPNGSIANIAGISNKEGNVVGLMPHPERASEKILGSDDGLIMFKSMIEYVKRRL